MSTLSKLDRTVIGYQLGKAAAYAVGIAGVHPHDEGRRVEKEAGW
jgi:hypothetical protein